MKKVLLVLAVLFFASCTPEQLKSNEEYQACPAPDTNCNGIPDHEEKPENSGG